MSGAESLRTPPAGTRCVDCRKNIAVVYAGNDPVCWECDESSTHKPAPHAAAEDVEAGAPKETRADTGAKRGPKPRAGGAPCAWPGCVHQAYPPNRFCTKAHAYRNKAPARAAATLQPDSALRNAVLPVVPPAAKVSAPQAAKAEAIGACAVTVVDFAEVEEAARKAPTWRDELWKRLLATTAAGKALRVELPSVAASKNLWDSLRARARRAGIEIGTRCSEGRGVRYLWVKGR